MAETTLRTFSRATQTSIPSANIQASATLFSANPARKAVIIMNTSTSTLYVLLGGGTATATAAHSIAMAANTSYAIEGFTGAATGIHSASNGQVNITELE